MPPCGHPAWRRATLLALALAVSVLGTAAPTQALVSSATTLVGPSADIRTLGGVAMADDGTGGAIFTVRAEGRDRVFVSRFNGGEWGPPQRVDIGQDFDSSWPALAAADGGRLVAVWVHEFGAADRLFSATLQPGAQRFEPPVPIDLNVGDSALGVYPSVSLNRGGQGYVAYRVITDGEPATVPRGLVFGEIRVARYTGGLWSGLGAPVNRNPAAPQRTPSAANAPRIATDVNGNAVVAWQEVDDEVVDRVYARRIFGAVTGIPLQVSPSTFGDRPLRGGADQFDLDVGPFGQAAIAYRQQPSPGAAITSPRVLVAQAPDVFQSAASAFAPPRLADGGTVEAPPSGAIQTASVAVAADRFATAFGVDATTRIVEGDDRGLEQAERLDKGGLEASTVPVVDLADSGAAVLAWRAGRGAGRGSVTLVERRADGVIGERTLSGARGGDVRDLFLAGSGLGDGVVAFLQGTGTGTQIVAGHVDAPPDVFAAQVPLNYVRGRTAPVEWDEAQHAIGGVRYAVTVDDDTVADDLTQREAVIPLADLDDGVRSLQVIATDSADQETTSVPALLRIDRTAPKVTVRVLRGRRVEVRMSDGRAGSVSGIDRARVRVTIGGRTTRGRTTVRRVVRPGRVRVVAVVRDRAGNSGTVRRTVRVR